MRHTSALLLTTAALLCTPGLAAAATPKPCRNVTADISCTQGNGKVPPGGTGKVSHAGWPPINGVFWMVNGTAGRSVVGTAKNDELLGHGGSDTIRGGAGRDVIWGDWDPVGNGPDQTDILSGGAGADWIFSSHGHNIIAGGSGADHIRAHYGFGTVDCGSGYDIVISTRHPKYKFKHCESVRGPVS
jgi:Ca2+-binding RTX toxin-like protein